MVDVTNCVTLIVFHHIILVLEYEHIAYNSKAMLHMITFFTLRFSPEVTWRDAQLLTAWSSNYLALSNTPGWHENGAGLKVFYLIYLSMLRRPFGSVKLIFTKPIHAYWQIYSSSGNSTGHILIGLVKMSFTDPLSGLNFVI